MIYTITKSIIVSPFAFGDTIGDTLDDTKRAARYLGESVIFCFAIYQLLIAGPETDNFLSKLPFAEEIIALGLIGSVMLTGLFTHPIASFFSGNKRSVHGSIASFLYWTGSSIFVIWPIIILMIVGSAPLFQFLNINPSWLLWIMLAIFVPFMFVYYVGTITSWIGRVYGMEPLMAGLAIVFSYTLSNGLGLVLFAIGSFIFDRFLSTNSVAMLSNLAF